MESLALGLSFDSVEQLIAAGGYLVLFGVLLACGMGLPLPEDIPLLIAGALIATGKMQVVPTAIAAWAGIIGGDLILYHLARRFGLGVTKLPIIGRHFTASRIERVEKMFAKWGIWVVAFGRLFAGIRAAVVAAAGAIRYPLWKFVLTDGIAALISGALFVFIGWWLGNTLKQHIHDIDEVKYWILIGTVVAAIVVIGYVIWRRRRRQRAAAAAAEQAAASQAATPPAPDEALPPAGVAAEDQERTSADR